jgi:uridine phosphorylase
MTKIISPADLIINNDGTVFHLKLKPEDIADTVLLVGDQGRVDLIASRFSKITVNKQNREFKTITGVYKNKNISVISTGIGPDNIDIVINELDALRNIDFTNRRIKEKTQSLNLIRIGTSGALHESIEPGSFILSKYSIGLDGLLNFYHLNYTEKERHLRNSFISSVEYPADLAKPYAVSASKSLSLLFEKITISGITLTAPGFYAPQGREVRYSRKYPSLNSQFRKFDFEGLKLANYEMESSALYGLSKLLGHQALTICLAIANRESNKAVSDYQAGMNNMIDAILEKL